MSDETRKDSDDTELPATELPRPSGMEHRAAETLPDSIGSYRVLSKLGEGGMGVVYEAEQESPKRRVAIKVVRGGQFVDAQRLRMFRREADTLALLKHPNIGGIYESGRTQDGQHFFAMELVRGETLDRYIANRPRGPSRDELHRRLRLFRKIGDAVHYAHQRGVIHRDLKPSNIIVTEEGAGGRELPEIKILDFGLARITDGDLATATMMTNVGVIKGTLAYMSPEQAQGKSDAIDVRTDVYALGVILYELLAGTRPYDVMQKALAEAVRVICEEPPRSLRESVSGISRIDHDMETIVGKALEKEVERRYPSAAALSEDVGRYLTSQPILARPPSAAYQLRKFAGRNRALVGGLAATVVALVGGITVSTVLGVREAAQRRDAERARDDLEKVAEFQAGMLDDLDPGAMGRRLKENLQARVADAAKRRAATQAGVQAALASFEASMLGVNTADAARQVIDEEVLDRAAKEIDVRFAAQPLLAARLQHTIGATYRTLGLFEKSEPHLTQAVELRKRELGADHPETLRSVRLLADLYADQGRFAEAEPLFLQVLDSHKRLLGDDDPETLRSKYRLAGLYSDVDRFAEAEPLLLATREAQERLLGHDHPDTLHSMSRLAMLYSYQHRFAEADALELETLQRERRAFGNEHTDTLGSMNNLAANYVQERRFEEAETLLLELLATETRLRGEEHPDTLNSVGNLAELRELQGRTEEAEALWLRILATRRRLQGEGHPEVLRTLRNLAGLYRRAGRPTDARPIVATILAFDRKAAEGPQGNSDAKNNYAYELLTCWPADLQDPVSALRFAVEANEQTGFKNVYSLDTLSLAYHRNGDTAKAIENQKKAVALLSDGNPELRQTLEAGLASYEEALAGKANAR